jgi:hypothetical protein
VAVLAALALLDPQQHALGVDVADLERDHLGDAQPGAVRGGERRPVLGPDAAWSRSATSSTLSTAGSRRGSCTTVSRRARSGRSSVTVKKKRRAETALLTLGGRMPVCVGAAGTGADPPPSPYRATGRAAIWRLGPEPGAKKTEPTANVAKLLRHGQKDAYVVSSGDPIGSTRRA